MMRAGTWSSIVLIYLLGVTAAATVSEAVPVMGGIAAFLHMSQAQGGLVISLPAVVIALGAVLGGWVVDRVGDKPVILVGSVAIMAGDLAVTFASNLGALYAGRVLGGAGYLCVAVAAVTMLTRTTTGRRRTIALSLWSSFVPVSFIIPFFLTGVVGAARDWRTAFHMHAAAALILGIAACLLPAPERKVQALPSDAHTAGLAQVIRTPVVFCLGLTFGAAAFMQTGVASTLPLFLQHHFGLPDFRASQIATLGMAANTLGCLTVGWGQTRGLSVRALVIGSVLAAVLSASALFMAHLALPATIAVVLAFFYATGLQVGLWTQLPKVAPTPQSLGATSGLITQLALWGVLFGPPAAFAAQSRAPSHMVFNIVGAGVVIVLLMRVVWTRTNQHAALDDHAAVARN